MTRLLVKLTSILGRLIKPFLRALARLTGKPPSKRPPPLVDGRYAGGNGGVSIELRVDEKVSGVISADLFRVDEGVETWVASLRTNPGTRVSLADGFWEITGEDQHRSVTAGHLTLAVQQSGPLTVAGSLRLDSPLAGIPAQAIDFTATRSSDSLRTLGIELEREQDVPALPTFDFGGRQVTVESALAQAGFETIRVREQGVVPEPPTSWGTAQLQALMHDHAQASLAKPAWEVHLLLLGRPSRRGLSGIMFDTTADLPRQGAAVFAEEVRRFSGADTDRKLIQTTVHELGHALNLAHRFERQLGRADSTSFMNYDWRYRGGRRRSEFWSRFDFTFDPDELEFLRHAPRSAVIPGGRAFHSVSYWAEGNGGYTPYYPEREMSGLELTLHGPTAGLFFQFLQPVFLRVELTNRTGEPRNLPEWFLDPKVGALDVVIRRVHGSGAAGEAHMWVPVMQRCYDYAASASDVVAESESIQRNLNLTFGASGFSFAEPGEYEVQAVVSLPR